MKTKTSTTEDGLDAVKAYALRHAELAIREIDAEIQGLQLKRAKLVRTLRDAAESGSTPESRYRTAAAVSQKVKCGGRQMNRLLWVLLIAGLCTQARADIIGITPSRNGNIVTWQDFDPALGTLTDIWMYSTATMSDSFFYSQTGLASMQGVFQILVSAPGHSVIGQSAQVLGVVLAPGFIPLHGTVFVGPHWDSNLNVFEGEDTWSMTIQPFFQPYYSSGSPTGGTGITLDSFSGSLSYEYTPVSTPEPSLFALIGLTLAGMWRIKRRVDDSLNRKRRGLQDLVADS